MTDPLKSKTPFSPHREVVANPPPNRPREGSTDGGGVHPDRRGTRYHNSLSGTPGRDRPRYHAPWSSNEPPRSLPPGQALPGRVEAQIGKPGQTDQPLLP